MPNIRTPWPLSGGLLEDAFKALKRFNQIFVAKKKGRNKILRGLTRENKHHRKLKWACGNYCGNLTVGLWERVYLEKGRKAGKGRNQGG